MTVAAEQSEIAKLQSELERYRSFFGEIDSFVNFVRDEKGRLKDAVAAEAAAKEAYDEARQVVKELRESIDCTKESLYRLVEPGADKYLPLFDRMEPADPDLHGEKSDQWRTDPIATLRLSPIAHQSLVDAEIMFVGQLQDRVLENPDGWYAKLDGISESIAAAIVDKLNDFIYRDGDR